MFEKVKSTSFLRSLLDDALKRFFNDIHKILSEMIIFTKKNEMLDYSTISETFSFRIVIVLLVTIVTSRVSSCCFL